MERESNLPIKARKDTKKPVYDGADEGVLSYFRGSCPGFALPRSCSV